MRTITPQPGFTVEDTEEALASGQFVFADCYTIMPKTGDYPRYTTAQQDVSVVSVGGITRHTYRSRVVLISGLRVKASVGINVDEQEVSLKYPENDTAYQNQLSWPQALLQGRLDGARIQRDRYIATRWGAPWLGGFTLFSGLVSSLNSVGRSEGTVSVKSDLVLLNVQMPRDLWEANCKNTWGDAACGITQNDWAEVGTVGPAPTRTYLPWTSSSSDFALGKIHIANGDSVTRVRTISRADASGLYLSYPLDFDPLEGLEFTAFPGCNRTKDRCPFFHGVDWPTRFKGFPFIPVAETAVG